MSRETKSGPAYDEAYFASHCGRPYQRDEGWLSFFRGMATTIVRDLNPASAMDAGCAMGFLVEALRDQGVDARGVDISGYAISQVREDMRPYCVEGSALEPFGRRYDLVTCIEVAEHLSRRDGRLLVQNLCRDTDTVLFSSTPLDFEESTHQNVQPTDHWVELFAREGLLPDVDYDASYVTDWALLFRRVPEAKRMPVQVLRAYERQRWRHWMEIQALRRARAQAEAELAARTAERDRALVELDPVTSSTAYRVATSARTWVHRVLPPDSRRGRMAIQLVRRMRGRRT